MCACVFSAFFCKHFAQPLCPKVCVCVFSKGDVDSGGVCEDDRCKACSYEVGMAEVSHRENCGLLAYSPLAFGVLTGKYLHGQRPEHGRITLYSRFTRYTSDLAEKAAAQYVALAKDSGMTPAQLALAFVTQQAFVTSNIIGATTEEQLEENLKSSEVVLSEEILAEIEAIHKRIPNPCP